LEDTSNKAAVACCNRYTYLDWIVPLSIFITNLLNNTSNSINYTALKGCIKEKLIGNDVESSGCGLILGTIVTFAWLN